MKGEIAQGILNPIKAEDWVVLLTDKSTYTLRLGGYKKETDPIVAFNYNEIPFPYKGRKIKEVLTDNFWVFILLDNGEVISSGEVDISFAGEPKLGVQFEKVTDFDNGFFESGDLVKLTTDETGWSKKQP